MFTNWLTNSLTPTTSDESNNEICNNKNTKASCGSNNNSINRHSEEVYSVTSAISSDATSSPSNYPNSRTNNNNNNSNNSNNNSNSNRNMNSFMTTPPDIILEVGPAPSVRFIAHGIVLGMHSGYLRSAIRLDDHHHQHQQQQQQQQQHHPQQQQNLVIFLNNVTPEQFAPLLTYMYTGYLDLNLENIFGVLLATHVLHMPRALEICRTFLSRAQANGYLGNALPPLATIANAAATSSAITSLSTTSQTPDLSSSSVVSSPLPSNKVIRPIASKATIPHIGFIPTPSTLMHHLALPIPSAPPAQPSAPAPLIQPSPTSATTPTNNHHHNHHQHHQQTSSIYPTTYHQAVAGGTAKYHERFNNHNNHNNNNNNSSSNKSSGGDDNNHHHHHNHANHHHHKNNNQIAPPPAISHNNKPNNHSSNNNNHDNTNDEDIEVFIDSNDNSLTSPDIDCSISVASSKEIDVEKDVYDINVVNVDSNAPPTPSPRQHITVESISQIQTSSKLKTSLTTSSPLQSSSSLSSNAVKPPPSARSIAKREKIRQNRSGNRTTRHRQKSPGVAASNNGGGLQIAKAPILACELDSIERSANSESSSKVIIDVASCDGPVRFRRILNTAYGHKPPQEGGSCGNSVTGGRSGAIIGDGSSHVGKVVDVYTNDIAGAYPTERTQKSLSLSFHQQMTKAINQRRQMQQNAEESENSESSGGLGENDNLVRGSGGRNGRGGGGSGGGSSSNSSSNNSTKNNNSKLTSGEVFVCVYCKHSFKSQYCYQKHAKRHLNPLSLSCNGGNTVTALATTNNKTQINEISISGREFSIKSDSANGNGRGRAPAFDGTAPTNQDLLNNFDDYSSHRRQIVCTTTTTITGPTVITSAATTPSAGGVGFAEGGGVGRKGVGETTAATTAELLRREVRPLDMNVQYYPCKTCGSKFPSYYFVHKHRKLCHAEEEAQDAENRRGGGGTGAGGRGRGGEGAGTGGEGAGTGGEEG